MSTVALVGNGPSLLDNEFGQEIDAHDLVVRIKRPVVAMRENPKSLGRRTDYVVGSMTLGPAVKAGLFPREYWTFSDPRNDDVSEQQLSRLRSAFLPDPVWIDPELCEYWQARYRTLRKDYTPASSQERKGPLSDEKGHRHCSAGMHGLVYAIYRLAPDKITLYGFDAVLSGEHSYSLTRGVDWNEYPDHNWPAEFAVLSQLIKEYGYCLDVSDGKGELCRLNT
jgi:hypothetical protein